MNKNICHTKLNTKSNDKVMRIKNLKIMINMDHSFK